MPKMNDCPLCSGPLLPLGKLGTHEHYRCRNCGGLFSDEPDIYGNGGLDDEDAEDHIEWEEQQ